MHINILNQKLFDSTSDVKVVFVVAKAFDHRWIRDKESFELLGFKGESEETLFVAASRILYVG
ncbi:MAG: leucyl aminopeptidase, partial [Epsilonproteobacteria bacterium]|nr:leucyl aminopeptidase [Campylobacterota bacterium]